MGKKSGKTSVIGKIENLSAVRAVRDGLINIIPVLIIGAFALILMFFPIDAYQEFIKTFGGGFLLKFFEIVNSATFGPLAVYMTVSISRSYMNIKSDENVETLGAITASLTSFFILAGTNLENFSIENLKPKSMFLALIAGLGASSAYLALSRFLSGKRRTLFSSGANRVFNRMLSTILPILIIVSVVAAVNLLVVYTFEVDCFRTLLMNFNNWLFSLIKVDFLRGFLFVLFSSLLWMFGIHGSDTLEGVMESYFTLGQSENPILSKPFFDCFVLMGGCGATICLLIALLLFSRNRARRGLAYTAAFPMLFNINELMVFGIPIVFNPIMLVPFLTVPLVCYSTAYVATALGLVPVITNAVEWTTPIILGGYSATGSVAGALLQVVNVILGVLIYMPFVKLLDKRTEAEAQRSFNTFLNFFKANESALAGKKLTDLEGENGEFAKGLCAEVMYSIRKGQITLAYQPQYDYAGDCIGAEALLRFKHPTHGVIYPPLIIKLAQDGGFLPELEEAVVKKMLSEREKVLEKFGKDIKISFNITATTVVTERFLSFMRELNAKEPFGGKNLCLEVTEKAALAFDESTRAVFSELRKMGLLLAIDDFSMGQTSLNYLKDNMFDIIKLDGSLVKGLSTHENCREIVSSIVALSKTLNLTVIAEYVETEWDRETLHKIGCDCYQGYLYSPAVFI
ncbi:MAG: PTS sugar transporter subunit IIC/EAL domain-containing protein [Clostridia bacterium]|nr:PTS sugar transporter subunit IIC/EAL domain-containing protein [Clostridia bacterium]